MVLKKLFLILVIVLSNGVQSTYAMDKQKSVWQSVKASLNNWGTKKSHTANESEAVIINPVFKPKQEAPVKKEKSSFFNRKSRTYQDPVREYVSQSTDPRSTNKTETPPAQLPDQKQETEKRHRSKTLIEEQFPLLDTQSSKKLANTPKNLANIGRAKSLKNMSVLREEAARRKEATEQLAWLIQQEVIDLEQVQETLNYNADLNSTDKAGNTIVMQLVKQLIDMPQSCHSNDLKARGSKIKALDRIVSDPNIIIEWGHKNKKHKTIQSLIEDAFNKDNERYAFLLAFSQCHQQGENTIAMRKKEKSASISYENSNMQKLQSESELNLLQKINTSTSQSEV